MRPIKVLVDSCSDVSGELLEKYNMDYVKMNTVYQGKETTASLTWENYSPQELYGVMRNGDRITTTQVPAAEFDRAFKQYLGEGYDVVYVGCSLKQSGSVNTGTVVAKEVLADYPGAKIECIDSLNASMGEGMIGIYAANLVKEGLSFGEVVEKTLAIRKKVNQFVTVGTLEWLRKAGRVKASSAFFGNLMGVKPILISDIEGYQTPVKKVKGRLNSINALVDMLAESIENAAEQTVYISHADCAQEEINYIKAAVKEKIAPKAIEVVYMGPIIGASIGPDAFGIWAIGKEVTYSVTESAK